MSQKDGTLVWADPQDWNTAVRRWLDHLPNNIRSEIEADDPKMYFFDEGTEWIGDRRVHCRDGQEIPGTRELLEGFKRTYSKVRMFHGCRTEDVGSYLRGGFLTPDVDKQMEKARGLFVTDRHPEITERDLSIAASKFCDLYEDCIYFCLDEAELINSCGHYLIYGSEYLQWIASELTRTTGVKCMEILRNIGVPTVFACEIPLPWIHEERVGNLLVELITFTVLWPYVNGQERPSTRFTFKFAGLLPADVIRSHRHPTWIRDPSDSKMYRQKHSFCPFCNRNP
jgi:hypothetical protein